jgi:hypothetical protein
MIAAWLSVKDMFVRRVGHPISGWLAAGGTETLVRVAAFGVVVVLFVAIIAISVDLLFGSGIFEQNTGCSGENPYDPCPGQTNIYSGEQPYGAD